MEYTLGKRIAENRKRLGLTQDALAEKLGVTAQAVSKWENDQSCPDITMLPKLAQVFGITTDALLGLEQTVLPAVAAGTAESSADDPQDGAPEKGAWEIQWDAGRKSSVAFAVWVLLVGALLFASSVLNWNAGFWEILWPSGLLIFGLLGLYPKFSAIRLSCAGIGLYFLINHVMVLPVRLNDALLLPACLLVLGVGLLIDALRKPRHGKFHISHNGKTLGSTSSNYCTYDGERFECATSFGENHHLIQLPQLSGGRAEVNFGELSVNLSGCEVPAKNCQLELSCAFGDLELLVPRKWKVITDSSTSFGGVEIQGSPDPAPEEVISAACSVSFGEITIRYI